MGKPSVLMMSFKTLSSSIPTPNLPPDPKINFDDLISEKINFRWKR